MGLSRVSPAWTSSQETAARVTGKLKGMGRLFHSLSIVLGRREPRDVCWCMLTPLLVFMGVLVQEELMK